MIYIYCAYAPASYSLFIIYLFVFVICRSFILFIVQLWRENVDRRTKINERKAINSIGRLQNIGHENYGTLDRLFAEFWTGDTKIMVMRMTTTGQEDSEILDKRDGRIWKENGKILARRTAENWTWQNISKEDS